MNVTFCSFGSSVARSGGIDHVIRRLCCCAAVLVTSFVSARSADAQLDATKDFRSRSVTDDQAFDSAIPQGDLDSFSHGTRGAADSLQPEPDWGTMSADCGYSCPPRWYAQGDVLWLTRETENELTLSRESDLGEFDYEPFYRLTIGHTNDCLDGWELSYLGGNHWHESATATGADLDSFLVPGGGFAAADFSAFNNAEFHRQDYDSELHSFEVNRRWWGWDVFSVKAGARLIHLDEEFSFFSRQAAGDQALLLVQTQNDLVMWQLGMDLMRPIGRLTVGGKLVGGIGLNFNDGGALIVNANDVKINTGDDSEELAFVIETGVYSMYRLTRHISLRAGYEGWFMGELALANEQVNNPINIFFGRSYDESGELFLHGAHAGIELVW